MPQPRFDESVDLAINLNVDPRHAEENIRITTSSEVLGKKVVLLVLAQGEKVKALMLVLTIGNKEYLIKLRVG